VYAAGRQENMFQEALCVERHDFVTYSTFILITQKSKEKKHKEH
jgi:hypothetical protein